MRHCIFIALAMSLFLPCATGEDLANNTSNQASATEESPPPSEQQATPEPEPAPAPELPFAEPEPEPAPAPELPSAEPEPEPEETPELPPAEPEPEPEAAPELLPAEPEPEPEAAPELPSAEPARETQASSAVRRQLDEVLAELAALRALVESLQEAFDVYVGSIVTDLQAENDRLREELRRLYLLQSRKPIVLPQAMPQPYGEPFEDTQDDGSPIQEAPAEPHEPTPLDTILLQDEMALQDAFKAEAPQELTYTPLSEWGRTPEEAAKLGDGATSLKGMVCVVPKGYNQDDLLALGRQLHNTLAAYDNINIEVFDDVAAARVFVEKNVDPLGHRVMSISKHRRSGRDAILLFRGDTVAEIPWTE